MGLGLGLGTAELLRPRKPERAHRGQPHLAVAERDPHQILLGGGDGYPNLVFYFPLLRQNFSGFGG